MKKYYSKRAYSISEVIIAMSVIVLLSLATVAACYVGTKVQSRAESTLNINNMSQEIVRQFNTCGRNIENKSDASDKQQFIKDFNSRLSFVLNSWEPNLKDFEGDKSLDGDFWKIELVLETESVLQDSDGEIVLVQTPKVGLNLKYFGADNNGSTYSFEWSYYSSILKLEVSLNVRSATYYLTIKGYYVDVDRPIMEISEQL